VRALSRASLAVDCPLVVVVGLIAQLALQAWWVDSVASLAIVYFLIKEGREAWSEGGYCG
jgi:divalent metal cation (Fe/Co/Zn/Cd) transporter